MIEWQLNRHACGLYHTHRILARRIERSALDARMMRLGARVNIARWNARSTKATQSAQRNRYDYPDQRDHRTQLREQLAMPGVKGQLMLGRNFDFACEHTLGKCAAIFIL